VTNNKKTNGTKNKLSDLNDHLFAQIERLADEDLTPDKIDHEVRRGAAIVSVADKILEMASLQIKATQVIAEHGIDPISRMGLIEQKDP